MTRFIRPKFTSRVVRRHQLLKTAFPQQTDNCHRLPYHYIAHQLTLFLDGKLAKHKLHRTVNLLFNKENKGNQKEYIEANALLDALKPSSDSFSMAKDLLKLLNSAKGNLSPGHRRINRRIGAKFDLKVSQAGTFTPNSKCLLQQVTPDNRLPINRDSGRLLTSRSDSGDGVTLGREVSPDKLSPASKALFFKHSQPEPPENNTLQPKQLFK